MSWADDNGISDYSAWDLPNRKTVDEIINKSILISGIEDKDNKIFLMEQTGGQQYPTKYSFFKETQAGEHSKAFTQYQEMGVSVGKVYTIAVKETQGVNKMSGKPVTYQNIAYFITGGTQTPNQTENPAQVNSAPQGTNYRPTKEAMGQRKEMEMVMDKKADSISNFQKAKEDSIRIASSGRDAVLIVTAFYPEFGTDMFAPSKDDLIKEKVKEWRKWLADNIYNDTPFI